MNRKERKGGNLNNREVEKVINRGKNADSKTHPYSGSQDTGDQKVRHMGNEVQQQDGIGRAEGAKENDSSRP